MTEVIVSAGQWQEHHANLKAAGFVRFEYVTAVHLGAEQFKFVSLVSTVDLAEQQISYSHDPISTLSEIYPIARFHEAEIQQMFGVAIAGLDSDERAFEVDFEGFPLRRDFALTDRVQRDWPGAIEPDANARRRPALAPGVLADWSE